MTGEDARQALTTRFIAQWESLQPGVVYFVEGNAEPDLTKLTTKFATFKVTLPGVEQAELSADPIKRYTGRVEVGLYVPAGGGTKPFFEMLGTIEAAFVAQTVSGIRLFSAVPIEREPAVGWQSWEVLVNYSFDSID